MLLEGKRVVIIGGSSGIGLETARLALAAGALVTIAGRSEERLWRAAKAISSSGDRLRSIVADLSDESSIRSLFAQESRVDHVFVPAGELQPGGGDLLKSDLDGLRSIRVNAVAPGLIDTPLWDSFGEQREAILANGAKLPVGRIGRPEEVAAAVIFLMSNGFITGIVLPIDRGGGLV